MLEFTLRFIGAGLLVAVLPHIAQGFGDWIAGVILLLPVVTVSGFLVLGLERGVAAVGQAASAAVAALPAVLMFLLVVHVAARQERSLGFALMAGIAAWLVTAGMATAIYVRVMAR